MDSHAATRDALSFCFAAMARLRNPSLRRAVRLVGSAPPPAAMTLARTLLPDMPEDQQADAALAVSLMARYHAPGARWDVKVPFGETLRNSPLVSGSQRVRLETAIRGDADVLARHLPGLVRIGTASHATLDWPLLLTDLWEYRTNPHVVRARWMQSLLTTKTVAA